MREKKLEMQKLHVSQSCGIKISLGKRLINACCVPDPQYLAPLNEVRRVMHRPHLQKGNSLVFY